MERLAKQLDNDRLARDAARGAFDQRFALVKRDLEARGVGGRIADKIGEDARDIFNEAVEVASAHRGVVAGTIAAVAIWIFRNPIITGIELLLDRDDG